MQKDESPLAQDSAHLKAESPEGSPGRNTSYHLPISQTEFVESPETMKTWRGGTECFSANTVNSTRSIEKPKPNSPPSKLNSPQKPKNGVNGTSGGIHRNLISGSNPPLPPRNKTKMSTFTNEPTPSHIKTRIKWTLWTMTSL